MNLFRQALNLLFAAAMPVTTYLTFSRDSTLMSTTNNAPIVPAGYAFSIWGLIYTASIAYAIYQALPAQRDNVILRKIGFATSVVFLFTSLWLVLERFNLIWFTVFCIIAILLWLGVAFKRLIAHPIPLTTTEKWLLEMPLSIFTGWISVAVFANIAAALQIFGISIAGIGETGMSFLLLLLSGILALFITVASRGNIWYVMTILWALIGISIANLNREGTISVAFLAAGLALVIVLVMLWSRSSGKRMKPDAVGKRGKTMILQQNN